ncbi:hypothetical protein INS49_000503 [Diaporthe citri]|uniref:uncharacterized protein n=1 Tax=Diaporthe citri TaxID=83186 RepID=UPI001C7FCF02|nr:uncharacterized protein INS49_000503 [Diaporthe citri]KAG6366326.1 hypothetical protein INS49_000503 [Diaporthe citri]
MSDQAPSPPSPPPSHWEPIDDRLLEEIYAADQAIYPAPLLTYERLKSWAAACPELCICLRRHGSEPPAQGVVIVLPVREEYWGCLVAGELREHDVKPRHMFPPNVAAASAVGAHVYSEKVKVGLHVFHVERYSPSSAGDGRRRMPPFTPAALEEIRSRVCERFPSWEVVGYSALTATPEGNMAFRRLGFTSRYVEAKADGDEAEMLVREGNDTFIPL